VPTASATAITPTATHIALVLCIRVTPFQTLAG